MTTLQFADTHNLVAFLTKSAESEGFEQIVDFLNASSIKYALTVNPTIYTSCIEQFWSTVKAKTVNGEVQLQALVDGKKIVVTEASVRRDLQLEDADGVDCLPNATIFEHLTLMGTMASVIICLATNQKFNFSKYIFESMVKNLDSAVKFLMYLRFVQVFLNNQLEGMATHNRIYIAPSHTKKVFVNIKRQGKDFSGRVTPLFPTMMVQAQEEMGEGSDMPTDPHHTPIITQPSSSQTQRKQKFRRPKEKDTQAPQFSVPSDPTNIVDEAVTEEPSMQPKELMDFYTKFQQRVLDLENTKTDEDRFRVNDLEGDEVVVESEVADKDANLSVYEVTLAQVLAALKSAKVQEKGDVIKEPSIPVRAASTKVSTVIPTTAATTITAVKDKGKGKMVEEEPVKKMSKKELLKLDEELAFKLQAEKDEEKRFAKEKAQKVKEANIAWDDIQDKVEVDYQMAQRLQAQEQEELSDAENATLFVQLLEKRRKFFARWKPKDLKNKSFANIQDLFDKAMKRRAGEALKQESSKKQKMDDDKETKELKQCMEIISDDGDDVTIKATPLSAKSLTIVDYKIYKEGKKSYFQIIRADGNSHMYLTFGKTLKNFDREDLEVFWSIVKARFKKTGLVNYMDIFLHLNLKTMFEHHLEDSVRKNQQGLVKVMNWKLYDSYGVHCVTMQNILYYLLVEKMYPLTKHTLHQMFNDVKLQVDYECEMAFELLRYVPQ
ncbi:hypothetical protein Tco_0904364 [Tanacetum coccineum]